MNSTWLSIGVVLLLIIIEAGFVAAEISLVSLREGQVRALSETGGRRGRTVARLVGNPNRFLGAVQLGVTLTALLAGAFGAITLSEHLRHAIEDAGLHGWPAHALGFVGVELVITYLTIVVGELVPKRLGTATATGHRDAGRADARPHRNAVQTGDLAVQRLHRRPGAAVRR